MSYTPPAGGAVAIELATLPAYTPPSVTLLQFDFGSAPASIGGFLEVELASPTAYTPPPGNALDFEMADTGEITGLIQFINVSGELTLAGFVPAKGVVAHTMPYGAVTLTGYLPTYKKSRTSTLSAPGLVTLAGNDPTYHNTKVSVITAYGQLSLFVFQPVYFKGYTQQIASVGSLQAIGNSGITTSKISHDTVPLGALTLAGYAVSHSVLSKLDVSGSLSLAATGITQKQRIRNQIVSRYFTPDVTLDNEGTLALSGYSPSHVMRIRHAIEGRHGLMYAVAAQIVGKYTGRVSSSVTSSYDVHATIASGIAGMYDVKTKDRVAVSIEAGYRFPVASGIDSSYSLRQSIQVRRSITSEYSALTNVRVRASILGTYSFRNTVRRGVTAQYSLTAPVRRGIDAYYSVSSIQRVGSEVVSIYSLPSSQVISIVNEPYLEYFGRRMGITEAELSTAEGEYSWKATVVLTRKEDYATLRQDQPFFVVIGAERYAFIVDSKELDRSAPANRGMKLLGISPSAKLTSPRHVATTYLWDTFTQAKAIAEELLPGIDWRLIDWAIPAYRFGVQDTTPMDAVRVLTEAIGGVIESNIDGTLYARSKYPVSVPQYPVVTPSHILVEETDILSVNESYVSFSTFNRLTITDISQDISDSLEWIPDYTEATTGIMRAFLYPWRSAVSLIHSGLPSVYIESPNQGMESHEEIIEVFQGSGGTQYPIHHIESVEYEAQNTGAILFDVDSRSFTVGGPSFNSVIRLVYWTRSIDYRVALPTTRPTQFLLESEPL